MKVQKASTDDIQTVGRKMPSAQAAVSAKMPPAAAKPLPQSAAPRSITALIAAAGLPADRLSASIVASARFFSLPLKPELLAEIRRQVFAASPVQPDAAKAAEADAAEAAAKNREALLLAAAACRDKGAAASPEGLAAYAAKIDPDWEGRQGSGGQGRRRKRRGEGEGADEKKAAITPASLREAALAAEADDPLLSLLNRLPGKSGRRWIVLPFAYDGGGREFRVSMRILLEGDGRAGRMVLDIAEMGEAHRRWLFAAKPAGDGPGSLAVFIWPDILPDVRTRLGRELSRLLGIPPAGVSVQNCPESFHWESSSADDILNSINEAV